MNQIICPKCKNKFSLEENQYEKILSNIRNEEFKKELEIRLQEIKKSYNKDLELEKQKIKHNFDKKIIEKDNEINILSEQAKNFSKDKELDILNVKKYFEEEILKKNGELSDLKNLLKIKNAEKELSEKSLKEKFDLTIKQKDETIAFYKDFKLKQSTKMIGESLEKHCENEFNKIRMTAFPNSVFGKDNDIKTGSKGDYIYREYDTDGIEIVSIMFEMKNENDETQNKKKNEHFFKELNKDRIEKKCEYAILVSMLEGDNEFYNNGIVDVSYQYEKMYVIRPQFFIPIITILRDAALNSLKYKKEVEIIKEQNIDITNFEKDLNSFKTAFLKNYNSASNNFKKAIDEIDKSIKKMEEVKRFLTTSENQLRLANNKLEDVTIKKLTKKNETMKKKFEELK